MHVLQGTPKHERPAPATPTYAKSPRLVVRRMAVFLAKWSSDMHVTLRHTDVPITQQSYTRDTWHACKQAPCKNVRMMLREVGALEIVALIHAFAGKP